MSKLLCKYPFIVGKFLFYRGKIGNIAVILPFFLVGNKSLFFDNKKFPRDIKKAIHYWTLEAQNKRGDISRGHNLAAIYLKGEGVPVNHKLGIKWLIRSAYRAHADDQFQLAIIYFKGEIVEENTNLGLCFLFMAVRNGYRKAFPLFQKIKKLGRIPADLLRKFKIDAQEYIDSEYRNCLLKNGLIAAGK